MEDFLNQFKDQSQPIINALKEQIKTIRTGRASPAIVENILVETYGGQSKLKLYELATISTEGPSIIIIIPFDPSTTSDIEKAILKSPINLSPQTQGNRIIIHLPPLSTEQREKFIKLLNQTVEEKRNNIRNLRDEIRKKIRQKFQEKQITEDIKFRLEKEIDNQSQKINQIIEEIKKKKAEEILNI